MTKVWFVVSLLVLLLWVIPTMVSYYKNQKVYSTKVEELQQLDKRVGAKLDAKPFHSEVFKVDAEDSFDKVQVSSIENNAYEVMIDMNSEKISTFHTFLNNLSLNYAVSVEDNIVYEELNNSIRVKMVVKPY